MVKNTTGEKFGIENFEGQKLCWKSCNLGDAQHYYIGKKSRKIPEKFDKIPSKS